MPEPAPDDELISRIVAREEDIRKIYGEVYPVLKGLDSSIFFSYEAQKLAALNTLDDPRTIRADKAVAIVKSLVRSTELDKLQFDYFYGVEMPGGNFIGAFIKERLHQLGIDDNDLAPYLRRHGWLREP
jgi:hypothetical protein